jgi:hypothetical protein
VEVVRILLSGNPSALEAKSLKKLNGVRIGGRHFIVLRQRDYAVFGLIPAHKKWQASIREPTPMATVQ